MASTNLGRVQGAGVFTTTAASGTSISSSTISPTNISPLVGDSVIFPNGDVRNVTAVSGGTITCGNVVTNIKGGGVGPSFHTIYHNENNTSASGINMDWGIDNPVAADITAKYSSIIIRGRWADETGLFASDSVFEIPFTPNQDKIIIRAPYSKILIPNWGYLYYLSGAYTNNISVWSFSTSCRCTVYGSSEISIMYMDFAPKEIIGILR